MSDLEPPQDDFESFESSTPGVQSFHRALQAALHSGVALELGTAKPSTAGKVALPSGRLTLSKLQVLQSTSLQQTTSLTARSDRPLSPTEMLTAAFGEVADALPQRYLDGYLVYALTGRSDLVLEAMSIDQRAEQELARIARPSFAYLALLALTAAIGSGLLTIVLLVIDDLRNDLRLLPHSMAISTDTKPWISESQVYLLPSISLALLLVALIFLLPPVSAWIVKCLGGLGYLRSQRRVVAARVEHALVQSGVKGADAEPVAARLVGFGAKQKRTLRTVSRNDQSQSHLQRLGLEAKHYYAWSNTRLRQLRFGLPILIVMTFGSAGVLMYSLTLFVPLTNLIYELSAPSIDPVTKGAKR